ncbi:hypothetical protein HELRODRAFT_83714 [Helobdella robusta]|uniref:ATP-dependent RNA helicase n=1 Tax=Helobdella robusta TaxID=6412 RepID=T1G595_HELRO|nr:hypothetical protein HELRODRAFT_83714 [Helobdella robusta]ESN99970.1 hypothetical protein HELRODRAFT_83714 [Helobdella robusta]
MDITMLTVVQQKAIPCIMQGKDVLVKSQTGSGKTMSYAIPIIEHLQSTEPKISRTYGPYCIVVVPTRELVLQSYSVLMNLVRPFVWVVPGYLMGGEKRKSEKARLKKGMNIIVTTPARLVDHLDNTSSLSLDNLKHFVVDEADRLMFDMGFERDLSHIMLVIKKKCGPQLQTILLSATLSPGVEKLAGMSLRQPVRIDMSSNDQQGNHLPDGKVDDVFVTPSSLKHHYVVVPSKLKLVTLASFLLWKCQLSSNPSKVIVFLATQDSVEFHHTLLQTTFMSPEDDDDACKDFELFKLYGNMQQKDRTKIFQDFHAAKSGVLLCTDVASRGLDLPNIGWILQYNTPGSPTDYIHRVGRTARMGSKGNALLFLEPSEVEYVQVMTQHNIAMHEVKMDSILKTLLLESKTGKINLIHKPRTVEDAAAFMQAQFEESLCQNMNMRTLARKAYQSFVRSYATYPASLKHIFHIKNLHLGHLATSFALSETPSRLSETVRKFCQRERKISSRFFGSKGKKNFKDSKGKKNFRDSKSERLPHWIDKKFEDKFVGHQPSKRLVRELIKFRSIHYCFFNSNCWIVKLMAFQ